MALAKYLTIFTITNYEHWPIFH